jgi:hypothetical protein
VSPDTSGMISCADAPLDCGERGLRALHLALNSPIVRLEGLPVGPASAAVAFHAGDTPGVTLVVRSQCSPRVVYFTAELDGEDAQYPEVILDAALSFAERMGFLFDEDAVGARDASALWVAFLGDEAEARDPLDALEARAAEEPLARVLEALAEPRAIAALPAPALMLSKFRRVVDAAG